MENISGLGNWTLSSVLEESGLGTFQYLLGVPIFFINFTAIVLLYKSKKLNFCIRIPALQMAISDTTLGLVMCLPNTIMHNSTLCLSKRYFIMVFYLVGALTISLMNADRYFSLHFPFRYSTTVTKGRMIAVCATWWIIGLLLPAFEKFCDQVIISHEREPLQWSFIVFSSLVLVNILEYCFVIKFIRKSSVSTRLKANRKGVVKVTLFTGCFVLCTFPSLLLNAILAAISKPDLPFLDRLRSILNIIALMNSLVNPILYCALFTECRFQLINLLCFWNESLMGKNKAKRNLFYCSYDMSASKRDSNII